MKTTMFKRVIVLQKILLALVLIFSINCFKGKGVIQSWEPVNSGIDEDLYDVFFITTDEGWACGRSGTLIHYFDGEWRNESDSTLSQYDLYSMFFVSQDDGWIGAGKGNTGTIFHYNGNSWQLIYETTSGPVRSVHFSSPDDGWAVSEDSVFHFNGTSWIGIWEPPPTILYLVDIFSSSPNSVWVLGRGSSSQYFLHFDGISWSLDSVPTPFFLNSIFFTDYSTGWAVGDAGTIYKIETDQISQVTSPLYADYKNVYFISKNEGWIVGVDEEGKGTAVHMIYDEAFVEDEGIDEGTLYSVFFLSNYIGWAVGSGGRIFKVKTK